jgi:hypothetical protein
MLPIDGHAGCDIFYEKGDLAHLISCDIFCECCQSKVMLAVTSFAKIGDFPI